jgi:hypothetical protein
VNNENNVVCQAAHKGEMGVEVVNKNGRKSGEVGVVGLVDKGPRLFTGN